ncbi:MAG: ORF6N domain-containing protein [Bacteroidota bacterium]
MNAEIIQNKIYEVREQKVMLELDLTELYQTETKYLKRSVRQNTSRFPADFMFELIKEEYDASRSNFSTLDRLFEKRK